MCVSACGTLSRHEAQDDDEGVNIIMKDRDIDSGTLTVGSIEEALMSYAQYVENQTRGE